MGRGWTATAGPLTNAVKMTERFRRTNFGNLEIAVTIDDLKAYRKPWTIRLHQVLVPRDQAAPG
jgi:hypothetical protein